MLFNSHLFIFLFLPFTFIIYFYLNKKRLTNLAKSFLVVASLFFYSWWNIVYLPLILGSIFVNFLIGSYLNPKRKLLLIVGIVANISLLGYFKYADFFIENVNWALDTEMGLLDLALPLAISFFTFQQIAYLVDSYYAEVKREGFLNYAVFVSFFPQLIAGPIVHHKEMMPQFSKMKNKVINHQNIAMGLFIFSMGLFKKVVIADTFAIYATAGFANATGLNFFEAWATSLSYTFQLYFDFSGYTDMAIGLALLFNIKLPINFNSPYKAQNIQDFWRRWHITLSRFLRDYIYIPLGGNRKSEHQTYSNLMITFIIGGLWHGAGWTFVFWGFLHGFALVVHRFWRSLGFKIHAWLAWLITFNFINITWVFFRAETWEDATNIIMRMFMIDMGSVDVEQVIYLVLACVVVLVFKNSNEQIKEFQINLKTMFLAMILFSLSVLSLNRVSEFLYFNF
ncbi:MAG: Probable poly(beta-D-mannuronate) O-acetylase (EC [uncultured Sulfurovum sp.]|uniref:Probable poly(Beta-D-mannuronate) O-acetylase (EC) n=1 Tax=uncultured Sulfurovum sp. TaxID=269237 RepID=A0A6S6SMK7_9BACT|nr:MAG: Probable poly(beta-D-mannuronate) O-acetylase (EC [uncultured Sulfurovum sp.]